MEPTFVYTLILAGSVFTLGILGVLWKRHAVSLLMGVEMMLNAGNLAFVAFAQEFGLMQGGLLVLFVMTVAAAEAGVGLAIFIAIFRSRRHIRVDEMDMMRG